MGINVTKAELLERIQKLEERLDLLTGKHRGPISMTEARLANERGDKLALQLYLDQFKKNPALLDKYINPSSPREQVRRLRAEPKNA